MATRTISDSDMDMPESKCSECCMVYYIAWNRSLEHDKPEYCPFCGEHIDVVIDERE